MKGNVWALAVLFIGLIVLAPALNLAHADSTVSAVENESTTVDYDTDYTLGVTEVEEYTSLTVTANNSTLTDGTDYTFDPANATVDWQNTTVTNDSDAAWVNYSYAYYDNTTALGTDALGGVAVAIGFVAVIAVLGVIFKITGGGW